MSEAMLPVKMNMGVLVFGTGNPINSKTGRVAIDLKRIVCAEEADSAQWGWEHATSVWLEAGGPHYLGVSLDDLLELWRAALCN